MGIALLGFSLLLISLVLLDGFEAMLLPRRMTRSFRFARLYYRLSWRAWSAIGRSLPRRRRDAILSFYGPSSIVGLFALWAFGLIVGFAVLHQAIGTPLNTPGGVRTPFDYLYMSGTTFFTLGFGDVTPSEAPGRALAVIEAGVGYGFLASSIGYLPVLYAAFSKREATIALLDARAGSPPTAGQALIRLAPTRRVDRLEGFLADWEQWSAELLESHLSFPTLAFYRSQHDNQSWLSTLTVILDATALLISRVEGFDPYQARLTFAIARHAAVDLSQVYRATPLASAVPRLAPEDSARLSAALSEAGIGLRDDPASVARFDELRALYEPFVDALAAYFVLTLPSILAEGSVDNWQTSSWMKRTVGLNRLAYAPVYDDQGPV